MRPNIPTGIVDSNILGFLQLVKKSPGGYLIYLAVFEAAVGKFWKGFWVNAWGLDL